MIKKDSAITKARILKVAEKLFSEKGFDGTRVDDIAHTADVNKALIYYYFKSKDDILDSLFTSAIKDIIELIEQTYEDIKLDDEEIEKIFNVMIDLISKKKRIISVMMMESLKKSNDRPHLFKVVDYFISSEVETVMQIFKEKGLMLPKNIDENQMMITEFFTGILPLINFVLYQEEWQKHYDITADELRKKFFTAFKMTHVAYHTALLRQ